MDVDRKDEYTIDLSEVENEPIRIEAYCRKPLLGIFSQPPAWGSRIDASFVEGYYQGAVTLAQGVISGSMSQDVEGLAALFLFRHYLELHLKYLTFHEKEVPLIKEEKFLRFMDNIEFVFKITARAIDSEHKLAVGDNEWDLLRKASKIRDRLTHPKTTRDLFVSVDELHIVGRAFDWLSVQIVELMFCLRKPKTPEIERLYREFQERKQRRGFITRVN